MYQSKADRVENTDCGPVIQGGYRSYTDYKLRCEKKNNENNKHYDSLYTWSTEAKVLNLYFSVSCTSVQLSRIPSLNMLSMLTDNADRFGLS